MRFSVVVPFYNSEAYIAGCIEGLVSQNYPAEDYEIIMVNNNSTDRSTEIVKGYLGVKLVHEGKAGAYAARNRGVREAKGEIIVFTDPDCEPSGNWLQEIERAMAHPGVGVVIGGHGLSGSFFLSMLADYENEKNNYIFNSRIKGFYYGYTRNMAVRKILFDKMGPFVEIARGADVVFVHRCINDYDYEVVRYSPTVQIKHTEIDTLSKYFRKVSIYGASMQKYRRIIPAKPLGNRERFVIFRRTVENRRYSWMKCVSLFGLLVIGAVCWGWGRTRDTWNLGKKAAP